MKILRSILAVLIGAVVSVAVIFAIQMINFVSYGPSPEKVFAIRMEEMKKMSEDSEKFKAWIKALPANAMVVVLLSWQAGAFFGGGLSGLIAGRARLLHAGIIGCIVLAFTVFNFFDMKRQYDISHPDWLIVAGLLLPLPISLLAGKIVSLLFPSPPTSNP